VALAEVWLRLTLVIILSPSLFDTDFVFLTATIAGAVASAIASASAVFLAGSVAGSITGSASS
jgi:hypothetical protein